MITEKDLAGIERAQEIAVDICMTTEKCKICGREFNAPLKPDEFLGEFLADYEMRMAELQADNEAAEKAARDNKPCEEIPF